MWLVPQTVSRDKLSGQKEQVTHTLEKRHEAIHRELENTLFMKFNENVKLLRENKSLT